MKAWLLGFLLKGVEVNRVDQAGPQWTGWRKPWVRDATLQEQRVQVASEHQVRGGVSRPQVYQHGQEERGAKPSAWETLLI